MNTLQSLLCEAITGNTGSFFDKIKLDITCNLCVIKEPWREGGVGVSSWLLSNTKKSLASLSGEKIGGFFFFFFLSSDLLKASVAAKEKSHRGRDRSQVLDLQPN